MLGWVITCHDDRRKRYWMRWRKNMGASSVPAANFWRGLSFYMLSRMMCDALHEADSGEVGY